MSFLTFRNHVSRLLQVNAEFDRFPWNYTVMGKVGIMTESRTILWDITHENIVLLDGYKNLGVGVRGWPGAVGRGGGGFSPVC